MSFFLCCDQKETPSMNARQSIPIGPAMSIASSQVPRLPLLCHGLSEIKIIQDLFILYAKRKGEISRQGKKLKNEVLMTEIASSNNHALC